MRPSRTFGKTSGDPTALETMEASELAQRGVYWARYTKNGRPILYAVDSKGDVVRRLVIQDDSTRRAEAAIEHLWNYLDVVDPKPQLHLVSPRPRPNPAIRIAVETPDPYDTPTLPFVRRN